jgi:hypothetical protein
MSALLDWLQATSFARTVAASAQITAWLSAVHVVGFAVVTGSALVANLRGLGVLFPASPLGDVLRPANRALLLGLAVSVATGAPLFAARAAEVAANGTFQLKMLLLAAAVVSQFTPLHENARETSSKPAARVVAGIRWALWVGLALAACAFILLE